jgi:predicted HicB family RNase H-like nuclease
MPTVNINLRLPPALHAQLKQDAKEQGVSLNTLILLTLVRNHTTH